MKKLFAVLFLLFAALCANAQTSTTITGTIKDLSGAVVTSGQVVFTPIPVQSATISGTARFTATPITCSITASGAVKALDGVSNCTLMTTTATSPTQGYKACIQPQFADEGNCFNIAAIGTSMDITTTVFTPASVPPNGLFVDNFTDQTIGGDKTFTGNTTVNTLAVSGSGALASTTATSFNNIQTINSSTAGADICAKIATGIAALPSDGGTVDARFFQGTQACASNPFASVTVPVKVLFGNVTVQSSVQWVIATSNVELTGSGMINTFLTYTGAGALSSFIKVSSATPSTVFVLQQHISDMTIGGNANVTDVLFLSGVNHGVFERLNLKNATQACLHTQFAVVNTFRNIQCSQNNQAMSPVPANGLLFDQIDLNHATTASTVIDPLIETLSGSGIKLTGANGINIIGGTSEGNARGIEITNVGTNSRNTVIGLDMEANSTEDVLDNANSGSDVYINLLSSSTFHVGSTANNISVINGSFNAITVDSGANNVSFKGTILYAVGGGVFTDNGTGTRVEQIINDVSGKVTGQPWTFRDSTPANAFTAIGIVDKQDTLTGVFNFSSTPVTISNTVVTSTTNWRVIFMGTWANNVEGGGLPSPAPYIEATKASPSFSIGTPTLTVSLNLNNQFQVATNANNVGFSGRIFIISGNIAAAGIESLRLAGAANIPFAWFTEQTAPAAQGSKDVCYGDSTSHTLKCSYNNDGFLSVPRTVASGTAAMTTAAIASGACGTTVTVAATNVATTDVIDWDRNAAVTAPNGLLTVNAWPTSGNVNFAYCNPTAASQTPAAATLNWSVRR